MTSDLHNLDNESIAVLYLSGELSAEDRAAVEARLGRDTALRAEVDRLRAAQGVVDNALKRADASRPLAISDAAASRKVARAMAQWRIDWLARPKTKPARPFNWRSLVPAAVAAAIVLCIGMFIWWSGVDKRLATEAVPNPDESITNVNAGEDQPPMSDDAVAEALAIHAPDDGEQLAGVEQQLSALDYLSQSMQEDRVSQ